MKLLKKYTGFTLIELLIAVIIIGVLVAIIVPVLANRAADARETAALKDLEAIANAESQVAIDIGYFVRLYALDDTSEGDAIGTGPGDRIDGIEDELGHQNAGNPQLLFLNSTYGNDLVSGQLEVDGPNILNKIVAMRTWRGPYMNASRKAGWQAPDIILTPSPSYGTPIDPWGNPYILFTQAGRMDEFSGSMSVGGDDRVFDRPTVLSLGPNGVRGDGAGSPYGSGDDLMRQF